VSSSACRAGCTASEVRSGVRIVILASSNALDNWTGGLGAGRWADPVGSADLPHERMAIANSPGSSYLRSVRHTSVDQTDARKPAGSGSGHLCSAKVG